jgi:hypothetical protein
VQLCLWYNCVLPSYTCVLKRFISYKHQIKIKCNFRTAAMLFFYILQHYIKVKILINIYYPTEPQDPKTSNASAAPTSQIRASAMLLFITYIYIYISFFVTLCSNAGHGSSFLRFLDHIKRHTTVGRTPLDEWSARRRDLCLTTHDSHQKTSMILGGGFEPTLPASERPQIYALDRAAAETGFVWYEFTNYSDGGGYLFI